MVLKKVKMVTVGVIVATMMVGCSSEISGSSVVAKVNKEKITVEYFEKNLNLQKQAIESMYGSDIWGKEVKPGVTYKDSFKDTVLDQIIGMNSIYDEAKKQNLLPSEKEISERVDMVKGSIDANEEYKKDLASNGIDDDFIKEQQAKDLAIEKYKESFYEKIEVSDDDAKKYYNENKNEFSIEEVKASHILIPTKGDDGKELSEKEVKEAEDKAKGILKQLKDGADFEEIAKRESTCTSGENGGDLGYFGKGQMVPEFEDAVFELDKGELSEVVKTDFGYHIIKLTDKKCDQRPFEEVRDYIKMKIKDIKFEEDIKNINERSSIRKYEDVIDKIKI